MPYIQPILQVLFSPLIHFTKRKCKKKVELESKEHEKINAKVPDR
jgi:hypothetical protein